MEEAEVNHEMKRQEKSGSLQGFPARRGRQASHAWLRSLLQQSNLHRTYGSLTDDRQVRQLWALASGAEWLMDIHHPTSAGTHLPK